MGSFSEKVLWYKAEQYLGKYRPTLVAVAGTYGRTMAAYAIESATHAHRHVRTVASPSAPIAIAEGVLGERRKGGEGLLSLLMKQGVKEISEFEPNTIIAEVPLFAPRVAQGVLARLVPRVLVLTHIGSEYLDMFGSQEMIAHEYRALAQSLASDAVVILNSDDAQLNEIRGHIGRPVITYGVHSEADIRATRVTRSEGGRGLFLEIASHGVRYEVFLQHLFAKQHLYGVLAGIATAHGLGVSVQDAIAGIKHMHPPAGSFSLPNGSQGPSIIDDTGGQSPESMESSLKSFTVFPSSGKKIAVLGDIENLASYSIHAHEKIGILAAHSAQIIAFVGDAMRHAQAAALKTGLPIDTHHFIDSTEAAVWLADHSKQGDAIYVGGGKQMNMKKVIQKLLEKKHAHGILTKFGDVVR